jgi:hypothetical protein
MVIPFKSHILLILSTDFETYKALIDKEKISGLTTLAFADPDEGLQKGAGSDM